MKLLLDKCARGPFEKAPAFLLVAVEKSCEDAKSVYGGDPK
jgi:hypothetical protein